MTIIKGSCPVCGEVELRPEDLSLMVCNLPRLSYYAFTCYGCQDEVRKPADDYVIRSLVSAGVPATRWDIPAEALEVHTGPRLSYDDLLDLALDLRAVDCLANLAGAA